MNISEKLVRLFDYQKFNGNERLQALIDDTESRYLHRLSDDDLEWVSAAGDDSTPAEMKDEKENG